MAEVFQAFISVLLIFPILLFSFVLFANKKMGLNAARSFGRAADITTVILFLSVPIAVESLFQYRPGSIILGLALVTGLWLTIREWKSKKEIEMMPLLRKIWRFLFLVLSLSYFMICCAGFVANAYAFLK